MELYAYIFLGLLLLSAIKKQEFIFWILIVLGILMYGLRAQSVGTDTQMYAMRYEAIMQGTSFAHFEFLYELLLIVLASYKAPIWVMQMCCGVLTLVPLAIVIKRSGVKPIFALFFYYAVFGYIISFNISRQMIAVSFVMLGYSFYPSRIKTLSCILIGMGFHSSAAIGLIIFLFKYIKLNYNVVVPALFLSLFFGYFVSNEMLGSILGKYAIYTTGALSSGNGFRETGVFSYMLLAILWDILFVIVSISASPELKQSRWYKLFFCMVIVNNLTFKSVLGKRIIFYYSLAQIILFPLLFKHNIERKPIILYIVIIGYVSLYFFKLMSASLNVYAPYETIKLASIFK